MRFKISCNYKKKIQFIDNLFKKAWKIYLFIIATHKISIDILAISAADEGIQVML